ncbi:hypothetical protein ASC75_20895 [Aminobacter sp. DSM 101952]|uniref:IncP-type conjugal transfer protein TrbI n=1 Tax=Aminobacter sp. DSM 101952 TaxID=2735891 RepID=UPI0006FEA895|nr:IncP-type conjugal transfer protein TrbI [Aminobacter sp. DSM 101952]KQU74481.1 hypothetical protein ASC75_20895 [Aminobacter sp. DSM 101952]
MVQSLQLGSSSDHSGIVRINRRPLFIAVAIVVVFVAVLFAGLMTRSLYLDAGSGLDEASGSPASNFADQLKNGVGNAIIGEKQAVVPQPSNGQTSPIRLQEVVLNQPVVPAASTPPSEESDEAWRQRLEREQREQYLRERHRQHLAKLQAFAAARDAPLAIDKSKLVTEAHDIHLGTSSSTLPDGDRSALDAALRSVAIDLNGQHGKAAFLQQQSKDNLGYLPNRMIRQRSERELKRGSVIPAIMVSGANSDLPGRLIAQVSQNVYDTATGRLLLVPQGTKLFGRYDSNVTFGQSRLLTVWTDLIFPDGSTLQIGGMPGTDSEGYGGFKDKVDRKLLQTYGSAVLVALIGAGTGLANPSNSRSDGAGQNFGDTARTSFSEVFGRLSERSIQRNMDVQPTVRIRSGYQFNIVVDQDIVFDTSPAP